MEEGWEPALEVAKEEVASTKGSQKSSPSVKPNSGTYPSPYDVMVDVPRFELGASSMPRKRASKLRHTPNMCRVTYADLRNVGAVGEHGRGTQGRS